MKQQIIKITFLFLFLFFSKAYAQDYFDDSQGNGNVIVDNSTDGPFLFIRPNVGDNSVKLNFFEKSRVWGNYSLLNPRGHSNFDIHHKPPNPKIDYYFGIGAYVKGKVENGLGSLLASGKIVPSISAGLYFSLQKNCLDSLVSKGFRFWLIILSANYTRSAYKLYNPSANFSSQLSDTTYDGFSGALSFSYLFPVGKDLVNGQYRPGSDLVIGGSVSIAQKNNYGSLDKVEIKDQTAYVDSSGAISRNVTKQEDSFIYAKGKYKESMRSTLKIFFTYVPHFFKNLIAFTFYPSCDFQKNYIPAYNFGTGINLLDEKNRLLTKAGIYFELNDLNNSRNSDKKFWNRAASIGFVTSWNVLSLK